ncbi:MAG TPA: hypothetical protein PKL23_04730 [Candidatus Egerieousia sp.]|nr:hypothetical protein [Candidatus Egerieousia sp.]
MSAASAINVSTLHTVSDLLDSMMIKNDNPAKVAITAFPVVEFLLSTSSRLAE